MKKICVAFGILLILSACSHYTAAIAPEQKVALKTIGVASIVGDSMNYTKVGFTVFTNENSDGDTSDWGIDDFVVSEVAAKLGKQYSIVPVEVNKQAFKASKEPIEKAAYAAIKPAGTPVDAYLLLVPTTVGDFIGGSYEKLHGLGIYRRPGHSIQIFAICDFLLIDAKSQDLLAGGQLGFISEGVTFKDILEARALSKSMMGGELAHRKIDPSLAKAKVWQEFTPDQLTEIKGITTSLLHDSFDYPLVGMGLIQ